MERVIRAYDPSGDEERLLSEKPAPSIPRLVLNRSAIHNRKVVHFCWMLATTVATIMVYLAILHPALSSVMAQSQAIANEVRIVHAEDKLDNLTAIVANNTADIKVSNAKIQSLTDIVNTLSSRLEGAYLFIKVSGSMLILIGGIGAYFTRGKRLVG